MIIKFTADGRDTTTDLDITATTTTNEESATTATEEDECTSAKKLKLCEGAVPVYAEIDGFFMLINFNKLKEVVEKLVKCPECGKRVTIKHEVEKRIGFCLEFSLGCSTHRSAVH